MGRWILVLDCNVYLDAARLTGEPFTSDAFHDLTVEHARDPVPHREDNAYDSLRLIAACQSGQAGDEALEVWTSDHILSTVHYKAMQSTSPDPRTGHRGLGWDAENADLLLTDLVEWIAQLSAGDNLTGHVGAIDNPPLDHEDGTVYGACKQLEGQNPLDQVYCVTRDVGFIRAYRDGHLSGQIIVQHPAEMLARIRARRRPVMPPPRRH